MSVPAVSISSSTMIARLPRTSPMTFISSARSRLPTRRFSMIASGASRSSANVRARLAKPRSVTTTRSLEVLVPEVVRQDVDGGQLVDRDVEEALDLALVEVHRQHPVRAGDGDHVGDEAGRDRDARLVLLVRAAVGVVRHDGRDPPGARALEGVDHDQQLHDRLVDRAARRLDDEDVLLADVVQDLDEDVLVGELEDLGLAELDAEVAADLPGQVGVRVAGVDVELVRVHGRVLLPTEPGSPGLEPVTAGRASRRPGRHCRRWPPAPPAPPGRRRSRRPGRPRRGASRSRRARREL